VQRLMLRRQQSKLQQHQRKLFKVQLHLQQINKRKLFRHKPA
jgi:hypothetical protein